ncbi:MAG: hypothetical protein ACOC22_04170 [bacterium]
MGVFPNDYTREEFKHFLTQHDVDEIVIQKFETLPEKVTYNNKEYVMSIRATHFTIGDGFYNYWSNYVGEAGILFEKRVFTDAEEAIDYLITGVGNLK